MVLLVTARGGASRGGRRCFSRRRVASAARGRPSRRQGAAVRQRSDAAWRARVRVRGSAPTAHLAPSSPRPRRTLLAAPSSPLLHAPSTRPHMPSTLRPPLALHAPNGWPPHALHAPGSAGLQLYPKRSLGVPVSRCTRPVLAAEVFPLVASLFECCLCARCFPGFWQAKGCSCGREQLESRVAYTYRDHTGHARGGCRTVYLYAGIGNCAVNRMDSGRGTYVHTM
mmetsp:Transcript_21936/g.47223  ORF Transcript_21936/g.47223 Transcript_21936/m.47223 type:complete len:226 (+) Transcript_21936:74-751(+)